MMEFQSIQTKLLNMAWLTTGLAQADFIVTKNSMLSFRPQKNIHIEATTTI